MGEAPRAFFPRTDRYEVRELLGSGSMGMVFRVFDREGCRELALKTLHSPDPDDLYRLKHEFRALASVNHRHLVQLYELEVQEAHGFFTMELVRGRDLLTHLSGSGHGPARDYDAVRSVFAQLAEGLAALHARGILHRDVKPMNVLVEDGGRVVLLDFGLSTGMERALSLVSHEQGFAGTLLYTSPEQAWGQRLSPAADWYSAGVMLYECLTGRLPFEGPGLEALLHRKHRVLRPPRDCVAEIPEDLDRLATALLLYEPERRATADEARGLLREGSAATTGRIVAPIAPGSAFVGRGAELAALRSAHDEARRGRAVMLRVEGPSGIGKTTLVERFLAEVEADGRTLVLRSRCHPNETVRYEAVDGLVDELSRHLSSLPSEQLDALKPLGARALLRMFPVLGRVPFAELRAEPDLGDADPAEVRRRAFAALRELLARIADRRPLVLWVDDLQWGDLDSAPLLREILRGPDAPALLLIATYRGEDCERSPLLAWLAAAEAEGSLDAARALALTPLEPAETQALLGALLATAPPGIAASARALAPEAGGSPFLLAELARFVADRGSEAAPAAGSFDFGAAIGARIVGLTEDARDLLELVAVCGRPVESNLLLDVVGATGKGRPRLYELCNDSLLRAVPPGGRFEPYHARLRDSVLEQLSAEARRRRHRQLAEGLSARADADPADVLEHFLGADDEQAAAPYALAAAAQADAVLAFDRAAELYELAFRLRGALDSDFELTERCGRALANAGRGSAAARSYQSAAAAAERSGRSDHVPAALRGRAAHQHFRAAELAEGVALLRKALLDLGVPLASSPGAALRSALALRLRFLARGTRFTEHAAASLPVRTLERLAVLEGAATTVSMLDTPLANELMARHLIEALRAGEPSRALRAIGLEAGFEANLGGRWLRRRSQRMLETAAELAERTGDPYDTAWVELCRSDTAWFCGRWRECVECGDRAAAIFRSRCVGTSWELASNHAFTISALVQLGWLSELARRLPELRSDAQARGDRYALNVFHTGDSVFVALRGDDPERARAEMDAGLPQWSGGSFLSQHFHEIFAAAHVELYHGAGEPALARMDRAWDAIRAAGLLRIDCIGNGLRHLRGRAAIVAGGEARSRGAIGEQRRLARQAEREASRIARSTLPHAGPLASALRAGAAGVARDLPRCIRHLTAGIEAFERCEMQLYAQSARWQLGRLLGGDEGAALVAQAETWMASEGIANPVAMAGMAVPIG